MDSANIRIPVVAEDKSTHCLEQFQMTHTNGLKNGWTGFLSEYIVECKFKMHGKGRSWHSSDYVHWRRVLFSIVLNPLIYGLFCPEICLVNFMTWKARFTVGSASFQGCRIFIQVFLWFISSSIFLK